MRKPAPETVIRDRYIPYLQDIEILETLQTMATRKSAFPYDLDFKKVDFRKHPELYVIGKGEQGVLLVEPYKSEILPHWRFRTPGIARKSARKIYALFLAYKKAEDFVGMDMARKFLQMGFTRARRYANHPSGRKYERGTKQILPQAADWQTSPKAESARIFYACYEKAKNDRKYVVLKAKHLAWSSSQTAGGD